MAKSHCDALLKQVLSSPTRCVRRVCSNNALQCDITIRATHFHLNCNALLSGGNALRRNTHPDNNALRDIKTRCTQGKVTSRRVIEAGSPYRDALREESLPQ